MKQKFYFILALVSFFVAAHLKTSAQNTIFTISGPTSVCPGVTYTYNLGPSGGCYSYFFSSSLNWSVSGGTITGYNNTTLDKSSTIYVQWSTVSNSNSITCSASTGASNPAPCNFTTGSGSLNGISLTIPTTATPTTPTSFQSNNSSLLICGGQVITFTANASSFAYGGIEYVWYYNINSGGYTAFDVTSSPTTTFTVPFLSNYTTHDVYGFTVRARSISCNNVISGSAAALTYTRHASAPTPDIKVCNNGSQGQVYLNNVSFPNGAISNAPTSYFLNINATQFSPLSINSNVVKLTNGTYAYQFHYYDNAYSPAKSVCMTSGSLVVNTANANPYTITVNQSPTPTTCPGGSNGQITTSPSSSGPSTAFTYSWSTGATSQNISSLSAGSYNVTVTDQHTCYASVTGISVGQPTAFSVSPTVTSNYNGAQISCNGNSDGQITVTASGGTGTLTYSIDDGATYKSSNVFNTLAASTYKVRVQDTKSCVSSAVSKGITAPSVVSPGTTTIIHPTCSGSANGSITVTGASGGTPSYTYSSGGTFQSSNVLSVPAGTYTVTVKDANGCSNTITNQKLNPAVTASYTATKVTCSGGSDGTITINASGGTGSFTYSKDDATYQGSNVFSGLSAGALTVYIKDGNGCKLSLGTTVPTNTPVAGSILPSSPVRCKGESNGALDLTPSGGVSPYTYLWSNGKTTEDISGIPAGTYSVEITDFKSCKKTVSYSLSEPLVLAASANLSDYNGFNVGCSGSLNGSIDLAVTGGTIPYSYAWSTSATTQDLSGLGAGHYSVNITDTRGCAVTKAFDLTTPDPLSLTIASAQNISCSGGNNGSISLSALGGTESYLYSINSTTAYQSSSDFLNLSAGSYTLRLKDTNGCITSTSKTLTAPALVVVSISNQQNTTCGQANGAATASATGGVPAYTYNWYNSANTLLTNTPDISNLNAGVYRVDVTDQNGCLKQKTVSISSSNGPAISVTSITPVTCYESLDGAATISISQGQSPYDILWPTGQTTNQGTGLGRGDQLVEVSDATGCKVFQTVTIPSPDEITIETITLNEPSCFGKNNGAIEVSAIGGNGSFSYLWSSGATTTAIQNLLAGSYTINVKDIKGCEKSKAFILADPPKFVIELGPTIEMCEGQNITINSNTENATCTWTSNTGFTSSQSQITVNKPGTYTVKAINANGCQAEDKVDLVINPHLLKTDFLMVTEAHVGDSVAVIDISWPLPEHITWDFGPAAQVVFDANDWALIKFDTEGVYTVELSAQLATCSGSHQQQITILKREDPDGGRVATHVIEDLTLFPNPNDGKFSIAIDLSEQFNVDIQFVSLSGNRVIFQEQLSGKDYYDRDYNFHDLKSGIYFLFVKAGKESKMIRLVIL
jgi:hypothetical protein